jgi:hypothetical protein
MKEEKLESVKKKIKELKQLAQQETPPDNNDKSPKLSTEMNTTPLSAKPKVFQNIPIIDEPDNFFHSKEHPYKGPADAIGRWVERGQESLVRAKEAKTPTKLVDKSTAMTPKPVTLQVTKESTPQATVKETTINKGPTILADTKPPDTSDTLIQTQSKTMLDHVPLIAQDATTHNFTKIEENLIGIQNLMDDLAKDVNLESSSQKESFFNPVSHSTPIKSSPAMTSKLEKAQKLLDFMPSTIDLSDEVTNLTTHSMKNTMTSDNATPHSIKDMTLATPKTLKPQTSENKSILDTLRPKTPTQVKEYINRYTSRLRDRAKLRKPFRYRDQNFTN